MLLFQDFDSTSSKYFGVSDIFIWDTLSDKRYRKSQMPKTKYSSALHHLLSGGSFVSTPSAVVLPRCLFDEIGYFDESLRLGEDTDLYTRAIIAGYSPLFTELASVIRRKHGNEQAMTASNMEHRIQNRLRAATKYYSSAKQQLDKVTFQNIHAEIYTNFASHYYRENYYFDWIRLSLISASYSSLRLAISNIRDDVRDSIKDFLRDIKKTTAP